MPDAVTPRLRQPPAEVDITVESVRALLRGQHRDLADEPIHPVEAGWDNVVFRVGAHLAVRLPRRFAAVELLVKEQTWLPQLASRLPLPLPTPIRIGNPGEGYPWPWSVVRWLEGAPADISAPDSTQGATLAALFHALHVPAPDNAPRNSWRGVSLSDRRDAVEPRMQRLAIDADTTRLNELWTRALEAPLDAPATWLHGDLHAQNVLASGGKLTGIIDWGDLCQGDRATDLAALWMLLGDRAARETAIRLCPNVSDATWARARGWAIFFGVMLSDMGPYNPRHAAAGQLTLRRLTEGP